ncbi:hypothetical protein AB0J21_10730 [Streptomyces sp. NPDC049954]|uniref:hypothetical protein n=1 Tax=Streptomyces sp. NPDC049954 TaxID=3155779 RepID=UPI00343C4F88
MVTMTTPIRGDGDGGCEGDGDGGWDSGMAADSGGRRGGGAPMLANTGRYGHFFAK